MISETTTSHLDVMFCALGVLLEAGHFIHHSSSTYGGIPPLSKTHDQDGAVAEWKRELASHGAKGASSVNDWVDGWFESLDLCGHRSRSKDVKRGNVETFLSGSYL
jgi:hypothetical protein